MRPRRRLGHDWGTDSRECMQSLFARSLPAPRVLRPPVRLFVLLTIVGCGAGWRRPEHWLCPVHSRPVSRYKSGRSGHTAAAWCHRRSRHGVGHPIPLGLSIAIVVGWGLDGSRWTRCAIGDPVAGFWKTAALGAAITLVALCPLRLVREWGHLSSDCEGARDVRLLRVPWAAGGRRDDKPVTDWHCCRNRSGVVCTWSLGASGDFNAYRRKRDRVRELTDVPFPSSDAPVPLVLADEEYPRGQLPPRDTFDRPGRRAIA